MQETWDMAQSLGPQDPLEEGMATHSSIKQPGGLQDRLAKSRTWLKWLRAHTIKYTSKDWDKICEFVPRARLYLTPPPLQQLASLLNAELNSVALWGLTDILVEWFYSNCCFLTCIQISQEAGQVIWYSHLFQNFPVYCDAHCQRFWHSQLSRNRCFSGTLLLFPWSSRCWQFDLWFLCLF